MNASGRAEHWENGTAFTNKRLRILMVVEKFPEISNPFLLNQITGLIDLGHDVTIFSLRIGDAEDEHSAVQRYKLHSKLYAMDDIGPSKWARVAYFIKHGGSLLATTPGLFFSSLNSFRYGKHARSLRLFYHVNSALKVPNRKFDIIHAQFGPLGNIMARLRDIGVVNGKLVTHFRGYDATLVVHSSGEDYYHDLFASGDQFLAVCEYIKKILVKLGSPREKTFVQYSGIDVDNFTYLSRDYHRKGKLRIGSIGRLSPKKGYEYILRALAILKREGFAFDYRIVGDGESREQILALIDECGLQRDVVLLGRRNHDFVKKFLTEIDIFVSHNVTSDAGDEEGIANTIKEAMLSGVPVFTTRHAGIPELVKHEVNGFLTAEKSVQQLVSVLKQYAFPLQELENLTRRARESVIAMFDNDKLNWELEARYYSLLRQDEPGSGTERHGPK